MVIVEPRKDIASYCSVSAYILCDALASSF